MAHPRAGERGRRCRRTEQEEMTIADSVIQRVRMRIEAFDADPKQLETFKQLMSQSAHFQYLAAAIGLLLTVEAFAT